MGKFLTYVKTENIYEAIGRASSLVKRRFGLANPFDYILKVEYIGGWIVEFTLEEKR